VFKSHDLVEGLASEIDIFANDLLLGQGAPDHELQKTVLMEASISMWWA
jgi:hypothetical protein